ncbi:mitochondrial carrier domain-containing protein [Mycena metata]|uniref:Mitochondrial carrier domain-containing protein n=1 Tax=Mycena metata TaxID=1033252 RepID=A0AAD7P3Q4_9AGAR|nr:mitochondrial carrier domain-containing protein [Mycena metata]
MWQRPPSTQRRSSMPVSDFLFERSLTSAIKSVRTAVGVPETELKRWRRIFDTNAKVVKGEKYLDPDSFVNAIAPSGDLSKIGRAQFAILFRVADTSRRGLVSWEDFTRPDADYWMAFQYFDVDHSGFIDYNEFKTNGSHVLGYNEFTQLMKGLQGERLRQAFKYLDKDTDGFILPEQFKQIILEIAGHKLSDAVIDRLPTLCTLSPGQRISYSEVIAFHNVIREATAKTKDGRIDQSDFLDHAASSSRYSLFTPMEASIIFHFAGRGSGAQRLALIDFAQLLDPRMQNQRSTVVGQLLYKNSLDCAKKILRNEGFLGFYRGLGPQLIGVAPEKAIKLTVNDIIRGRATDPETGRIKLGWELVAGGTAGGCQVVFTNPLEIVKIRLQVQGEAAKAEGFAPKGAVHIIRQLGVLGLYRGASACLLRDIPFSAIYFPTYGHFEEGYIPRGLQWEAAFLHVVKTRLQVEARKGQTNYKGLTDAFVQIYREEGFRALFKGGPARIVRSSPQFAFTLMSYEMFKKMYPWDAKPRQMETALTVRPDEMSKVRARNALRILLDVHGDFGRRAVGGKAVS